MVEASVDSLADVRNDSEAFFSVAESLESTGSSEYFGASDWGETRPTDVTGGDAAGTSLAAAHLPVDTMETSNIVEPETQQAEPVAQAAPKQPAAGQVENKENAGPEASAPAAAVPSGKPATSFAGNEIEEVPVVAVTDGPVDEPKTTSGKKSFSKKLSQIRSSLGRSGKKVKGAGSPSVAEGEKSLLKGDGAGSDEKQHPPVESPPKKSASMTKRLKQMLSKTESGNKSLQEPERTEKEPTEPEPTSVEGGVAGQNVDKTDTGENQEGEVGGKGVQEEFTNPLVTGEAAGGVDAAATVAKKLAETEVTSIEGVNTQEAASQKTEPEPEQQGVPKEAPKQDVPPLPIQQSLGRSSIGEDGGLFSGNAAAIAAELKPHVSPRVSGRGTPKNSPHGGRRTPPPKPTIDVTIEATDAENVKVTLSPVGEKPGSDESGKPPAEKNLNFFQRMFTLGKKEQDVKEEEKLMLEAEEEKDVGYSLTNRGVEKLCVDLDAALTEQGIDYKKNFNKSLNDFDNVVDFFVAMEASFGTDESAPGIRETLAKELGGDHPLVVEIQRKQTLEEIKAIDEHVKSSIDAEGAKKSEEIFTENPEDYKTSVEYYQTLEATAKTHGITLVPALTEKLGKEHPLVAALAVEEDIPEEADATAELVSSGGTKPELPVSQGGILSEESNEPTNKSRLRIVRDETAEPRGMCGCACLKA